MMAKQHHLKATVAFVGPCTITLFLTGWWMRPGCRWWCVRLPGLLHARLGPLQLTWRGARR